MIKLGIQGNIGSFSEEAARVFAEAANIQDFKNNLTLFIAVKKYRDK